MNKKYRIRVIVAIIVGVLAVLAFLGIAYPVRIFDIQLGALVQRVFIDFSIVALALLLFALVMTFLFGRLYCSTLCPFGLLQEVACTFKKKNAGKQKNLPVKYVVAAASFGMLAGGTAYYYRLVEPYTYFGALFTLGGLVAVLAAVVVIITVFKDRVFCTNFCPVGAVLGVISKFSPNKIYIEKDACVLCSKCEKICQAGAIDFKAKAIDNEMCVKCLKCLNGVCPTKAIKYGCNCKKEKN
ncbi:MAG: 4Fe-4S binding protein, partial [Elusimicrobia bacterium]|nr:4Fe-4S binding protein [Elusimicrobiota bacterium]